MSNNQADSQEFSKKVIFIVKKLSEDGVLDRMEQDFVKILEESSDFKDIENSLQQICEKPNYMNYGEIFNEMAGGTYGMSEEKECLDKQILQLLKHSNKMQLSAATKMKVFQEWKEIIKIWNKTNP